MASQISSYELEQRLLYYKDKEINIETLFFNIFENNHSVMLIIAPETGSIVDANHRACSYYGYNKELLLTKKIQEINVLEDDEVEQEMEKAKAEKRKYFNFRHLVSSGEIKDVEVYSGPVKYNGKTHLYSIIHDITKRLKAQREKEQLITKLETALKEIKTLKGIIPVCSNCKKIRDDSGYWKLLEEYLKEHSDVECSHGICPECIEKLYPEFLDEDVL